jgi:hypothetical protein
LWKRYLISNFFFYKRTNKTWLEPEKIILRREEHVLSSDIKILILNDTYLIHLSAFLYFLSLWNWIYCFKFQKSIRIRTHIFFKWDKISLWKYHSRHDYSFHFYTYKYHFFFFDNLYLPIIVDDCLNACECEN